MGVQASELFNLIEKFLGDSSMLKTDWNSVHAVEITSLDRNKVHMGILVCKNFVEGYQALVKKDEQYHEQT